MYEKLAVAEALEVELSMKTPFLDVRSPYLYPSFIIYCNLFKSTTQGDKTNHTPQTAFIQCQNGTRLGHPWYTMPSMSLAHYLDEKRESEIEIS
jgi:hypothetical protein